MGQQKARDAVCAAKRWCCTPRVGTSIFAIGYVLSIAALAVTASLKPVIFRCEGILGMVVALGGIQVVLGAGLLLYMGSSAVKHNTCPARLQSACCRPTAGGVAAASSASAGHATFAIAGSEAEELQALDDAPVGTPLLKSYGAAPAWKRCNRGCAAFSFAFTLCGLTALFSWVAGLLVLWAVHNTLPTIDGTLSGLAGLHGSVDVYRDGKGVPHIVASANDLDAFYAQGIVHAQDRLWQMEFQRRVGSGTLSAVVGSAALDTDKLMLTLGVYEAAQRAYPVLSPVTKSVLEAYAAGVNFYIAMATGKSIPGIDTSSASHSSAYTLPLEFHLLGHTPAPWTPADSLVWAKILAYELCGNMEKETTRFQLATKHGLSFQRIDELLVPFDTTDFPTILSQADLAQSFPQAQAQAGGDVESRPGGATEPSDVVKAAIAAARAAVDAAVQAAAAAAPEPVDAARLRGDAPPAESSWWNAVRLHHSPVSGVPHLGMRRGFKTANSNNWVVGSTLAASGAPLLANDPHLNFMTPSIWMLMHLSTGPGVAPGGLFPTTLDVMGATLPGVPGVVIGHNDVIAWGVTNTGADVQDTYMLQVNPSNPGQYWYNGSWTDFELRPKTILVKGEDSVPLPLRYTPYGVVITDNNVLNATYAVPLALRWVVTDPTVDDTTMDAFLALNYAKDWSAFRTALSTYVAPSQNFIFASAAGDIGYQMPGLIPIRKPEIGYTGAYPSPGDGNTTYMWAGFHPFASLPFVHNPPEGFIATANNRVVPLNYSAYGVPFLTADWDEGSDGYRAARITAMIKAKAGKHTKDTMVDIQQDYYSGLAESILAAVAALPSTAFSTAAGRGFAAAMAGWDRTLPIGSALAAPFVSLYARIAAASKPQTGVDIWGDMVWAVRLINAATDPLCTAAGYATCAAFLAASVDATGRQYGFNEDGTFPSSGPASPSTWGHNVHLASFPHQVLGQSPLACLANREVAHGGDDSTVNVGHPDLQPDGSGSMTQEVGPSYREIIDLGDLSSSLFTHTVGQDGNVLGTNYDTLLPLWSTGKYLPMDLLPADYRAAAANHQVLTP